MINSAIKLTCTFTMKEKRFATENLFDGIHN